MPQRAPKRVHLLNAAGHANSSDAVVHVVIGVLPLVAAESSGERLNRRKDYPMELGMSYPTGRPMCS